ncbi:MAG TPA: glycogen synthase GlgA [archaeon]|nr:glycogen synthase GlgA [archaeon]
MNILIAASEMVPFAQTGGLGDVIGSLPGALAELGVKVSAIIPLYSQINRKKYGLLPYGRVRSVPIASRTESYRLFKAAHGPVEVYFVDKPEYFDRDELYSSSPGHYPDEAERFIFFSRVVAEFAAGKRPGLHVLHSHDWHTGIVPVYLANLYQDKKGFKDIASVFTIHNMGYQGIFPKDAMQLTGLSWSVFNPEGLEFYNRLNLLKGGIIFSDAVTAVSHRYAEEIQTGEFGYGLEGVVSHHKEKLFGILNGADYEEWNPASDRYLPVRFSPEKPDGKAVCKQALQTELGLKVDGKVPLIGMVGRLVEQKGIELLLESIDRLVSLDLQLVILGTGTEKVHQQLKEFCSSRLERCACVFRFENRLSHLIEAGSDFFLMPSLYEPCGLNQIYSLKYGTVPIVRAVGGLEDTVIDVLENPARGNGFKFREYSPAALMETVGQAVTYYHQRKTDWKKIMANAFSADFSWTLSARRYLEVYNWAYQKKTGKKADS